MDFIDDIVKENNGCKQCGDKSEIRIASNLITILLHVWCMATCRDQLLIKVLIFLAAGHGLILARQLIVYWRRK